MFSIGDFSRINAARSPDKAALILDGSVLSYGALDALSNQLGRALLARGVAAGDRVGILSFNSPEYAVVIQAVAKIGAILVPFNVRHSPQEIAAQIEESAPRAIFCEQASRELLRRACADGPGAGETLVIEEWLQPEPRWHLAQGSFDEAALDLPVEPRTAAAIMYTSGSTGRAKGVMISHENYIRIFTAVAIEFDMRERDVVQAVMPFFHNGGFASVLCPALMLGATAVCERGPFDAGRVLASIARERITLTHWIPTMLAAVVERAEQGGHDLSSLRKIHYGAMPISPALLERATRVFDADFYQFYASTDAGLIARLGPEDHRARRGVTARPIFSTLMRIVDERGADVPPGGVGEIIVDGSTSGMIGYWGNPAATAEVIRDGWIHTGDMARREADSFFTLIDRKNSMIISGGENIFPAEVESAILAHPAVLEAAVSGAPDPVFGENVCAFVVLRDGAALDLEELRRHCEGRLARYKLPKRLILVEALPRTGNGKLARGQLARLAACAA